MRYILLYKSKSYSQGCQKSIEAGLKLKQNEINIPYLFFAKIIHEAKPKFFQDE